MEVFPFAPLILRPALADNHGAIPRRPPHIFSIECRLRRDVQDARYPGSRTIVSQLLRRDSKLPYVPKHHGRDNRELFRSDSSDYSDRLDIATFSTNTFSPPLTLKTALILDNTVQSNALGDCIFWYKAPLRTPTSGNFKIGCHAYHAFARRRGKKDDVLPDETTVTGPRPPATASKPRVIVKKLN